MSTIRALTAVALLGAASLAQAKLPPPSDEAKVKAAEAAAKGAHAGKVAAYQLCKSQDKVAAVYFVSAKKNSREVKPAVVMPPCADPGPFAAASAAK